VEGKGDKASLDSLGRLQDVLLSTAKKNMEIVDDT